VARRAHGDRPDRPDLTDLTDQQRWALYAPWLDHADPATRANAIICLIHQANYLLDQQIAALEQAFVEDGGYSEQLATARLAERERRRRDPPDPSDRPDPSNSIPRCPKCGRPLALRTAKTGKNAGQQFWGCTGYPECKGTAEL
jgi:restriction system protein